MEAWSDVVSVARPVVLLIGFLAPLRVEEDPRAMADALVGAPRRPVATRPVTTFADVAKQARATFSR